MSEDLHKNGLLYSLRTNFPISDSPGSSWLAGARDDTRGLATAGNGLICMQISTDVASRQICERMGFYWYTDCSRNESAHKQPVALSEFIIGARISASGRSMTFLPEIRGN